MQSLSNRNSVGKPHAEETRRRWQEILEQVRGERVAEALLTHKCAFCGGDTGAIYENLRDRAFCSADCWAEFNDIPGIDEYSHADDLEDSPC